jgi:hypothetical protein
MSAFLHEFSIFFIATGLALKQRDLHSSLIILFKSGLEFSHVVFCKMEGFFITINLHFVILCCQASASRTLFGDTFNHVPISKVSTVTPFDQ